MAVSVLKRPEGLILSSTLVSGVYVNNASGTARFNKASHGLVDGDYIYFICNVEDYNGFWYVNQIDVNNFQLREYATGTDISYVALVNDGTYYKYTATHKWSAVHLPIVYKLSNTLWPTNSEDTARDITAVTDSAGYCNVTAAGDIKATGSAAALEFVKITGCTDTTLNGIWQIVTYSSDTSFILSIPYSAATDTDLTNNATIQYYYNNYAVRVRVYGGLPSAFTASKPNALIAELKLTPDTNNRVIFSISDILKSQIYNKNNLLVHSYPIDIDSFTIFYIEYAESYDDSDGTTLSTTTSSYTSDPSDPFGLEGIAINADMPFKNVYSGFLTEYVLNDNTQKFLTTFDNPVIFSGEYFDISALINFTGDDISLQQTYLLNSVVQTQTLTRFTNLGRGLYRFKLTDPNCAYDQVKVQLINFSSEVPFTEEKTIDINCDCSNQNIYLTWKNHLGAMEYWKFTAEKEKQVDIISSTTTKKNIFPDWPKSYGANADTIEKQVSRESKDGWIVRSQYLTEDQRDAIAYIKSSSLVQILESRSDRRTVIVDSDSFKVYDEGEKQFAISFKINYTNNIPTQRG